MRGLNKLNENLKRVHQLFPTVVPIESIREHKFTSRGVGDLDTYSVEINGLPIGSYVVSTDLEFGETYEGLKLNNSTDFYLSRDLHLASTYPNPSQSGRYGNLTAKLDYTPPSIPPVQEKPITQGQLDLF